MVALCEPLVLSDVLTDCDRDIDGLPLLLDVLLMHTVLDAVMLIELELIPLTVTVNEGDVVSVFDSDVLKLELTVSVGDKLGVPLALELIDVEEVEDSEPDTHDDTLDVRDGVMVVDTEFDTLMEREGLTVTLEEPDDDRHADVVSVTLLHTEDDSDVVGHADIDKVVVGLAVPDIVSVLVAQREGESDPHEEPDAENDPE